MLMQMQLTEGYWERCADYYGTCLVDHRVAAFQGEPRIIEEVEEENLTVFGATATTMDGLRYLVRFETHRYDEELDYNHPTTVERIGWNYTKPLDRTREKKRRWY